MHSHEACVHCRAEDWREYTFASLDVKEELLPTNTEEEFMAQLVDAMDLTQGEPQLQDQHLVLCRQYLVLFQKRQTLIIE